MLDRLDERQEALKAPEVFALDQAALAEVLEGRRELLTELAGETHGELRTLLEERALAQPAVDGAMLDSWDEDRARVVEEHNLAWLEEVVGNDLRRDDGEEIDLPEYWRTAQIGYERLVLGCRAPEMADGPEQETGQDPPRGRLAFYRPRDRGSTDEGGNIVVTSERGTNEQELEISEIPGASDDPRRWTPTGWLDSSPSPDHHLLVNARAGDEHAMVEVSLDGTIVDFVQRSTDGPIACPGWDSRGERVLAATESRYANERRVLLLDLTRTTPSGPAPLPLVTASCSDFITDRRIVVSDAAIDIDDEGAVWTVGIDGTDPQELYRADGCTTQVGSVDPGATRAALAQTCDDPLDNGIVVVDLTSGESQRVATGTAALPKWSPDGEWLVFGYSPLGEGPRLGVWMAQPDGRQLRQVVASPAWFPVWLPPA
ncbi:MAG TPA: hypothetical protein VFI47_03855 [Acidimicrobiales bacterium]|nr:hypothetical protein [Acidimicrobiales bacterium]